MWEMFICYFRALLAKQLLNLYILMTLKSVGVFGGADGCHERTYKLKMSRAAALAIID